MIGVALGFGVAILAVACQTPGPAGLQSAVVTRVYDGDSGLLELGGTEIEVRLQGINAPERDECFYREARDHLTDGIEGETVGLERTGTDQFGRALAYVWLDPVMVNLDLVAGGFAVATAPGEGEAHGESILGAERLAASEGRGLWSATVCGGTGALPGIEIDAGGSRFDPEGRDEEMLDQEWVTFRSPVTLDLGGWTLRDESSAHRCALAPNSRIGPRDREVPRM